jgi:hypothetical protein
MARPAPDGSGPRTISGEIAVTIPWRCFEGDDLKGRAEGLLKRRAMGATMEAISSDDVALAGFLSETTPWQDDRFADIAYFHGLAYHRCLDVLKNQHSISSLLDPLLDSIEDWLSCRMASFGTPSTQSLVLLNQRLLDEYGVGSRKLVGTIILLNADTPFACCACRQFGHGRFGYNDIARAVDESLAYGLDPVYTLLLLHENRSRWYELFETETARDEHPLHWYDSDDGDPEFAGLAFRFRVELPPQMTLETRHQITQALSKS